MSSVLAAFPRRPLTLRSGRGTFGGWVLAFIAVILFGAFAAMMAMEVVPALRDDFTVRETAAPTATGRMTEGRCRSRAMILQSCEMTLTWRAKDGPHTRQVSYMFVEPHFGNWTVQVLTDPARPDLVTTDMGLDRLWNRVITAAVFAAFLVAMAIGGFFALRRSQRTKRLVRSMSGKVLMPVPVLFRGWGQGPTWRVQDERGASFEWPVRKGDKPFVLDEARGLVLALRDPAGGPAFPLDEKLRLVDLDKAERDHIRAVQHGPMPVMRPA